MSRRRTLFVRLLVALAFVLVAAACGGGNVASGGDEVATTAGSEAPGTEAPGTEVPGTEAPSGETTTTTMGAVASTTAAPPEVEGVPVPDFELALSNGEVFRLADEQKPVFLVFWAEW